MSDDILVQFFETFTLVGVLFAFVIFARLAVKARGLGGFRYQLSLFMLIWVVAEIPHIAGTLGLISTGSYDALGLFIHMVSMATFAWFVGVKSYRYFNPRPLAPLGAWKFGQPQGTGGGLDSDKPELR